MLQTTIGWGGGCHSCKGAVMEKLLAITPGELLKEEFLEPLGISQYRLAKEIGVPAQRIGQIVLGNRRITADTDLRLWVLRLKRRLLAARPRGRRFRSCSRENSSRAETHQTMERKSRLPVMKNVCSRAIDAMPPKVPRKNCNFAKKSLEKVARCLKSPLEKFKNPGQKSLNSFTVPFVYERHS